MKDGILHCTGKPNGYVYTKGSYSRYTLEAELAFERPKRNGKKSKTLSVTARYSIKNGW